MKNHTNQNCHNSAFTLVELLVVVAILLLLAAIVVGSMGTGCVNVSHGKGEKIGQVVKFSQQGFIRDTWEGQLIRGGMSGGSGSFGTVPFNFTVEGSGLVKKVQEYMRDQTEVVITYRIEGVYSPFRSESSGHFLIGVEPAKKVEPEKTR